MPSTPESASIGKAVAARVGSNIREVRTTMGMTQSQLAAPEFSISSISAIERGKIRPSLRALSILARRLDVPLTFLLEGSPSQAAEARTIGYSPADAGPDQKIDVDLLQASVLVQQGEARAAEAVIAAIVPERITTEQAYRLFFLRGQIHLAEGKHQEAVADLRNAVVQGEGLNDREFTERARALLGRAYYHLTNYQLALENHTHCLDAITTKRITDPFFALDVYTAVADDYLRLSDSDRAVTYYHQALDVLGHLSRDTRSFAREYLAISRQYADDGKLAMARDYAMKSLALYQMRGEHTAIGMTHQRLGKALERQNLFDEAEEQERQAIAILREVQDAVALSTCHTELSELLLGRGRPQEAEQEAQEALKYARESGDAQTQGQALFALAQLRHQLGDYQAADTLFAESLAMLDASHAHDSAASASFRFANLLEERGEVQQSLTAIKRAYEHQSQGKPSDME